MYLRVPQARVEQKLTANVTLSGGIVAPVAGDAGRHSSSRLWLAPANGRNVRHSRAGSATPAAIVTRRASSRPGLRALRLAAGRDPVERFWAVAIDGNARIGRLGAAGEYFTADNAEPFGGGISQAGRSSGGWAEGRVTVTPRTMLTGGFGIDHPTDAVGRLTRSDNRSAFSSVIFDFTPEVSTSIEYRWLRTRLGLVPQSRENHHLDAVFVVRF